MKKGNSTSLLYVWTLLLWLTIFVASTARGAEIYIVKPGDSAYGIAQKLGISPKALMERNSLSRNQHIYPGQKLVLPPKSKGTTARAPQLPATVQRAITNAKVKSGRWKHIVIHHSAVDNGTVKGMEHYHRNIRHMENGLAYHFVIGNGKGMEDGEIAVGRRWTAQLDGGHLASLAQNRVAIGICLVGNFDKNVPSAKQLQSLRALSKALMTRCKLSTSCIKTHQQINTIGTRCPGSKFPFTSFIQSLNLDT